MILDNLKKKIILIKLLLAFFISFNYLVASENIKIIKKVNNEIITNFDILNEFNYLSSLNNDLKNLNINEAKKIAEESLIREKIKLNEIKKYISIEDFENDGNNRSLIDNIIQNIHINLNKKTLLEFENYLNEYDIKIIDVRKKITIEVIWNKIINNKYKNQININEKELKDKIKKNNLGSKNLIEYDLSEIVFQAKNQNELNYKINEIEKSINDFGFKVTANKFSISNTSNIGGQIGKVKENQLSDKISKELNKTKIGNFTKPINMGNRFLILFVNNKNTINQKLDENEILKTMVEYEKKSQFENYSQIYFDKIKLNTHIQ